MFHYLIGKVQTARVFDQSPTRLATRSVPSHGDVFLKTGDDAGSPVTSLDRDGFEEEVHGMYESLLRSRGAFGCEAGPITTWMIEQLDVLISQTRDANLFVNFPT